MLLAGYATGACDGDTSTDPPPTSESPRPEADAYGVALATVLDDPPPDDADDRTVVFVVPLDGGVDIDTQAALIERFADAYDLRFVDDLTAAVQTDDPERAPRDDGIVLGVGTIASEAPHLVRLERYRSADEVEAHLLTLELDDDGWVVATTDPVPAEVLVDAL